jgi:hypothetical protein
MSMKIEENIKTILAGAARLGTYTLPELLKFARIKKINGIAVAVSEAKEFDLALLDGEPDGALLIEEKGTLYGDKAVMLLSGNETFELYDVKHNLVEAVAVGCRILEKGHLRKSHIEIVPEIGKRSDGLGVLSITVRRNGVPQNGMRVSIRKDGQMFCNDVTTQNGLVCFKLMHGKYDCIVQDRAMMIHTVHIIFDAEHPRITLEI